MSRNVCGSKAKSSSRSGQATGWLQSTDKVLLGQLGCRSVSLGPHYFHISLEGWGQSLGLQNSAEPGAEEHNVGKVNTTATAVDSKNEERPARNTSGPRQLKTTVGIDP